LLQHAAVRVTAALAGPPDLHPETENTPGQQHRAVQRLGRNAEVVHLAPLEGRFSRALSDQSAVRDSPTRNS